MEKPLAMHTFENLNIGEVCRSCFESCEQYKMLYEDAENSEKRSLGDVFFDVVKIEVKTSIDQSPSRICLACFRDLINAYNFIQKSKHNNDRFVEYLKTTGLRQDCLSEFPIDIPNDTTPADYHLQIKIENEAINDYDDSLADDKISPGSTSGSADSSDYEEPLHNKVKINKMQCPYCERIFKRQDFLENHKRKHEEEIKKKKEAGEEISTFVCDECGLSFGIKKDFDEHLTNEHPASIDYSSTSSQSTSKDVLKIDDSLPLILHRNYFIVVDQRKTTRHQQVSNGVLALCQVCKRKISGSVKVTSNFLQHLKHKHPELYRKYLEEKSWIQPPNKTKSRHQMFDQKILTFVVETFSPLSIVESPSFVDLFKGTHLEVQSCRHISDLLCKKYVDMVAVLRSTIRKTEYVCCTADIWAVRGRSFFGYTCHWIGYDYKRKSAVLSCRRFDGTKNYNTIGEIISSINDQFGITEKQLVHTVTGNGSNFMKAFQEFGISSTELDSEEEISEFIDHTLPDCAPYLNDYAKHLRCASQTLHFLATFDFLKALREYPDAYDMHMQAIKKCTQIWSKYKCVTKAEKGRGVSKVSLRTPTTTRWNSLYDGIRDILKYSYKLQDIANLLDVEILDPSELEYLDEYCQFMKPIAEGLEFLQKEDDIYFGYLIPILLTIKQKLRKFSLSPGANYLKQICSILIESLIDRFRPYFEMQQPSHEAAIAAITCPTIKILNQTRLMQIWRETAEHCTVENLEKLFLNEVNNSSITAAEFSEQKKITPSLKTHPFFSLDDSDEDDWSEAGSDKSKENRMIKRELKSFLKIEDYSPHALEKHPVVKQMFFKFNTALPSSAPVEKLFTFAELLEHHRRQNLSDDDFEKIFLLKTNRFMK